MFDHEAARRRARARLERQLTTRTDQAAAARRTDGIAKVIVGTVIAMVIIGTLIWAVTDHQNWEKSCERRGGHVASHTNWGNNNDGDTTYYCLNGEGGIIDIR